MDGNRQSYTRERRLRWSELCISFLGPKRAVSTVVVDDGKTSIHLKRKESWLHLIMDYACFVSILGSKEVKTTGRIPACRECGNKIDAHYCNSGPSNTTTALLLVSDHLTESR
mmetsp:Transcript_9141/g.22229  ORF Transcript_9141/g.22229 Transcript_9141/m.22229 type:complete len:113 (-) Transcript_9141:726-1064(-)